MFLRVKELIRKVINIFSKSDLEKRTGVEIAVSNVMVTLIDLWTRHYKGNPPYLYRPDGNRDETVETLRLPSAIAAKVAKMVTLEAETKVTGSKRADYLDEQYQRVVGNIRKSTEYAAAKGGIIFKPYVSGASIEVDIVQAGRFFPTAFNSRGDITGAIFFERIVRGERYLTRLELQNFSANKIEIKNFAFRSKSEDSLGDEIPLASVPEWEDIEPESQITGVERAMFSYFKMPFANEADEDSPLGVSIFARAVDIIKQADLQYSRILWEYEGGELAIDADITAVKSGKDGKLTVPQRKERLFRGLNIDGGNNRGDFYQVFSPEFRDTSLFNGLNRLFQRIEFACGLSYGTISDPQLIEKTAEEIKSSKQDSYGTITDIQMALEKALKELIYCIDVLTTLYKLAPAGKCETSFKWDDSIIVNAELERQQDLQEIRDGIMQKWEYRKKWYGEDEETAKKMVAQEPADDDLMGFRR
jgi:A118 family predicted phage portal protein